jgi:hypothetical protein
MEKISMRFETKVLGKNDCPGKREMIMKALSSYGYEGRAAPKPALGQYFALPNKQPRKDPGKGSGCD